MNIAELKNSRFLTKEECGDGIEVTIDRVEQDNVAPTGQAAEMRYVLTFQEDIKPMVLNSTNGQRIAAFLGSPDSEDWQGKKVILYHDENVDFAGKIVGGIRVRRHSEDVAEDVTLDVSF